MNHDVCVVRHVLGEPLDILFNIEKKTFRACDGPPAGAWVLGDRDADLSLDILSDLSLIPVRSSPPERFVKAMEHLSPGSPVRWRYVLPGPIFKGLIDDLLGDITGLIEMGCVDYYKDTFRRTRACLRALEGAHVDASMLDRYLHDEPNASNRSSLESLRPGPDGLTRPIRYCQTSTVTGRLTVETGPRILTLPKRYKDVITSRYQGGSIVSLDYSSLEPRVALLRTGRTPPDDVYAYVADNIMGGTLSRKQSKIVTISLLYGASEKTICELSGLRNGDLRAAIDSISAYFNMAELQGLLLEQARKDDTIRNGYERPVRAVDRRKLINYYDQSTAADIPLLGFLSGIELIRQKGWMMHPLFVIHDALMVDVHPDHLRYLEDVRSTCERVPGFQSRFPVAIEVICSRTMS